MEDDCSGYVSALLPDGHACCDASRAAVSSAKLLIRDMDGRLVGGSSGKAPPCEASVHTAVLARARTSPPPGIFIPPFEA